MAKEKPSEKSPDDAAGKSQPPSSEASPPAAAAATTSPRLAKHAGDNPTRPARFEVRTPNKSYTEAKRQVIPFKDGVGWTDDAAKAQHCRTLGYSVVDHEKAA